MNIITMPPKDKGDKEDRDRGRVYQPTYEEICKMRKLIFADFQKNSSIKVMPEDLWKLVEMRLQTLISARISPKDMEKDA